MDEAAYEREASRLLEAWLEAVEAADKEGVIDADLQGGVLALALPDGRQYLISRHTPSRQIWVSSPLSGGLHFSRAGGGWALPDGRGLEAVVTEELRALCGLAITVK